jgi:4-hydroxybenzoate polyprenyltransferase
MRIKARLLIQGMRPRQWTKNGFVLIGLIFSVSFVDISLVVKATIAFICFCFLSSGGYLLNDMIDAEKDRRHPYKRLRPIASGALSFGQAAIAAAALIVGALVIGLRLHLLFGCVLIAYLFVNLLYSFWLKKIVIIDIFTIASFFIMRAVAGAVVINVKMSSWLLIVTLFLALFLAAIKRRAELMLMAEDAEATRLVLAEYGLKFLDQMIMISATATILCYALYTFGSIHSDKLMFTLPFVAYGIFRYLYLLYNKKMAGVPEEEFLRDWPFMLNLVLYVASVIGVLSYFR